MVRHCCFHCSFQRSRSASFCRCAAALSRVPPGYESEAGTGESQLGDDPLPSRPQLSHGSCQPSVGMATRADSRVMSRPACGVAAGCGRKYRAGSRAPAPSRSQCKTCMHVMSPNRTRPKTRPKAEVELERVP